MELQHIWRILIAIALLAQILHIIYVNKQIYPPTFIVYAIGVYILGYGYHIEDSYNFTSRVNFVLFNASALLLIGLLCLIR
jgi:uncharacterized membrane protein